MFREGCPTRWPEQGTRCNIQRHCHIMKQVHCLIAPHHRQTKDSLCSYINPHWSPRTNVWKLGNTSSSSTVFLITSWINFSTLVTFFNTCLSAWPISLSMKMFGKRRWPIGGGFPSSPPAEGGAVCAERSSSPFSGGVEDGVLDDAEGPYGSRSSRMHRWTLWWSPWYAIASWPLKSNPVIESLIGRDMNMGEG